MKKFPFILLAISFLLITQAFSQQRRWRITMSNGTGFTDQKYKSSYSIPTEWIKSLGSEGYAITDAACEESGKLYVIMSKNTGYIDQIHFGINPGAPEIIEGMTHRQRSGRIIETYEQKGYSLTDVTSSLRNSKITFYSMSKGEEHKKGFSKYGGDEVEYNEISYFPMGWVDARMKEGYRIVDMSSLAVDWTQIAKEKKNAEAKRNAEIRAVEMQRERERQAQRAKAQSALKRGISISNKRSEIKWYHYTKEGYYETVWVDGKQRTYYREPQKRKIYELTYAKASFYNSNPYPLKLKIQVSAKTKENRWDRYSYKSKTVSQTYSIRIGAKSSYNFSQSFDTETVGYWDGGTICLNCGTEKHWQYIDDQSITFKVLEVQKTN